MATKMCFFTNLDRVFEEKVIEFNYIKGMAFSQKQKNVLSFHSSIREKFPQGNIIEISTKSENPLGVKLSAFNLKLDGTSVESIFQSSKVFEGNVQFEFLKKYNAKEAKQYVTKANHGSLISFVYKGQTFPLLPPSLFYDYIYIKALSEIPNTSKMLIEYDIFTDIEFNEKKQTNCQARACAIYSYMLRTSSVQCYMKSIEHFKELYGKQEQQISLF